MVGAFYFLICYFDGNRTRSNNKQSGGLFVRRGNERSEAIGAGAPRQIPITRSKREVVPLGAASLFLYGWESNKEQ